MEKLDMKRGADLVIEAVERHGVEYIFGHAGGAAMPIFDALVDTRNYLTLKSTVVNYPKMNVQIIEN